MKANEFVKKSGWDEAISLIDASKICGVDKSIVDIEELKRLVDSHELVVVWRMPESWRDAHDGDIFGLDGARMYLEMHGNYELSGEELDRFKQAIADVESCQ